MKAECRKYLSVSFALEAWPRITEREEAPRANFARKALLPKIILRALKSFSSYTFKATFASYYLIECDSLRVSFAQKLGEETIRFLNFS